MFSTIMPKSGFRLRPLEMRDQRALETRICADPDIAKTLAHDSSSAETCREVAERWCLDDAIDSPESLWDERGFGLWAILTPDEDGKEGQFVGTRGFFLDPALPEGGIEAFVAIAQAYWGQGLSGESSRLLLSYIYENTKVDAIYTNIWPILNPGSEAVQRKIGFNRIGRVSVRDSFGEERMRQIRSFELWRLRNAKPEQLASVLREVSIKFGMFSAECLFSTDEAHKTIVEALAEHGDADEQTAGTIRGFISEGYEHPAWATYRFSRSDWERSSIGV